MTRVLAIAAAAFVAGTLIATMPHNENEPCLDGRELETVKMETVWWPLATRCVYGDRAVVDLGPSVPTTLVWIVVCAAAFMLSRGLAIGLAGLASVSAAAFVAGWPPALVLALLLLPAMAVAARGSGPRRLRSRC